VPFRTSHGGPRPEHGPRPKRRQATLKQHVADLAARRRRRQEGTRDPESRLGSSQGRFGSAKPPMEQPKHAWSFPSGGQEKLGARSRFRKGGSRKFRPPLACCEGGSKSPGLRLPLPEGGQRNVCSDQRFPRRAPRRPGTAGDFLVAAGGACAPLRDLLKGAQEFWDGLLGFLVRSKLLRRPPAAS